MDKKTEALKLALEALEGERVFTLRPDHEGKELTPAKVTNAITAIREALAEQPAQQQKEGFASPGGGYVPAIPRPMPLDWKLVPRKATPEMLKAMDECAQEGYDERLYAGMASSVYMAAWDASPVMGTLPEQPAQQEPVAIEYWLQDTMETGRWVTTDSMARATAEKMLSGEYGDVYPRGRIVEPFPPASKPLTDAQIGAVAADIWGSVLIAPQSYQAFARAIEAAHGIKGNA